MKPYTCPLPESLMRMMKEDAVPHLHPCASKGCDHYTFSDYCTRCEQRMTERRQKAILRAARREKRCEMRRRFIHRCRRIGWKIADFIFDLSDEVADTWDEEVEWPRKSLLQRFGEWTPSEDDLRRMATCVRWICDRALVAFSVLVVIYLAAEVAIAFSPGGPVDQIRRFAQ